MTSAASAGRWWASSTLPSGLINVPPLKPATGTSMPNVSIICIMALGGRPLARLKNTPAARKARNFAESDRLRDELAAMGVQLMDGKGPDGQPTTTWEVKR